MKNKPNLFLLSLSLLGLMFISSCKKDDPSPAPKAAADNVDMGTNTSTTINVLDNDSYSGAVSIQVNNSINDFGRMVVNSNNTITYTPTKNFYGTATYNYILKDDNGTALGAIVVKVGTDAQIRTYTILDAYKPQNALALYAIDGDTSRIYENTYFNASLSYLGYSEYKLIIYSSDIMPNMGYNTYSIVGDGSIVSMANDNTGYVTFQVLDHFTATAKKYDGSETREVKGFTIQYDGHTLDYATALPCEFTNPSSCIN